MHLNARIAALLDGFNNPLLPGIDLSLTRMVQLLAALGNPEQRLPPVIHIAGTNGKGSTLAFLRAIYTAAGYRVHAYTSPHLVRFNERILLAGSEISDAYLEQLLAQVSAAAQRIPVTFFEATTAAAFLAFSQHHADVLLLETGLGGRLDATNVVAAPIATILTPVDYDHMEFLGETLGQIAAEKAGILKRSAACFVGAQWPEAREVIKRAARAHAGRLVLYGRDWEYQAMADGSVTVLSGTQRWVLPPPALVGTHQHHNAALASVVALGVTQLPVSPEALARGVAEAYWPARLQRLSHGALVTAWGARGAVYLDGGHNAHAARALEGWIKAQNQPVTLMLGMMQRKDADAFLRPLAPLLAGVIAVPIPGTPCYDPAALAQLARDHGVAQVGVAETLEAAPTLMNGAEKGVLLIAGSLFLAGEVLKNHS